MTWLFAIWYFLECRFLCVQVYVCLRSFFKSLQFFIHFKNLRRFCYVLSVSITYNRNVFLSFEFLFHLSLCFIYWFVGIIFSLLFWKVLIYFYFFILSECLLSVPSFANIFWFISSSCIVSLVCCYLFRSLYSVMSVCIFPSLVLSLVLEVFLFILQASFPIQLLDFYLDSFGKYQFSN